MRKYSILFVIIILCWIACNNNNNEITWQNNIEAALANSQNKPIMVDFKAEWCPPCQKMEKTTFSNPEIIEKVDSFITVRIDVDKQKKTAKKYNGNASKYGGVGIPNILFLNSNGEKLRHIIGYQNAEQLTAVMDSVLTGGYEPTKIN